MDSCLLVLTDTAVMFRGSGSSNLSRSDRHRGAVHLDLAYWRSYVMSKQLPPSVGVSQARVTSASSDHQHQQQPDSRGWSQGSGRVRQETRHCRGGGSGLLFTRTDRETDARTTRTHHASG